MSQQINLYEPRLRPRRLLLTGSRLAIAFGLVLALCVAVSAWARWQADQVGAESLRLQAEVKTWQEQHDALVKQLVEKRIPANVQSELDNARAMVAVRRDVIGLLDAGRLGNAEGFSSVFRGFARQSERDLWLTGFSVSQGGQEIEIRGKLLDSTKLPGYVQRLASDPAFQGRRFAALTVASVNPADAKAAGASPEVAGAATADAKLPRHVEFVLRSENAGDMTKTTGTKP